MSIEQTLKNEIQESKRWVDKAEGVYKRDLIKRIELINWVLDNMKIRILTFVLLLRLE
jgi:hypothetical protein